MEEDPLLYWRSLFNWVVCPKISLRKKIRRKVGKWGIKSHRQILQGHVAPHEKFGNERVHRKELCTSASLKNAIRVRQSMRRGHFRKPCDTNDAPAEKHGTWQNMLLSSKQGTRPRSALLPKHGWCRHPRPLKARGARNLGRFRSVDAHAEQKADKDIGEVPSSEEAQVHVHDLELFVTVQMLDDTSAVLSLGKLCGEHGLYLWVGQWSKTRIWPKMGKIILWKTEKFVRCPRSVFKLKLKFVFHTVPAGLIEYLSESSKITKWRHSRSSIGRPWRSSQNQKQKRKRRATTKPREVDCAISQSGLRSSQIISKIQKCQHSQALLMTQIRNVAREPGSTAFVPTSRKIEIAKSASESGLRGLLAGSALAKPYSGAGKFGDLLTADHKVLTEGGESRNNHRCAVVVQELATQWIQKNFSGDGKEHESFSSRQKSQKSFILIIHWNLANPVKIYHGIIELRHIIELRRGYCWKSGTQNKRREVCVLLQSGLDEKWWADYSMECYCYLRNVHDLIADGIWGTN